MGWNPAITGAEGSITTTIVTGSISIIGDPGRIHISGQLMAMQCTSYSTVLGLVKGPAALAGQSTVPTQSGHARYFALQ